MRETLLTGSGCSACGFPADYFSCAKVYLMMIDGD